MNFQIIQLDILDMKWDWFLPRLQLRWVPARWNVTSRWIVPCGACDQAASVEPGGFERLVKYIRVAEASVGDGVKKVYDSEKASIKKLRRVNDDK